MTTVHTIAHRETEYITLRKFDCPQRAKLTKFSLFLKWERDICTVFFFYIISYADLYKDAHLQEYSRAVFYK
jgi:hypothetical protein